MEWDCPALLIRIAKAGDVDDEEGEMEERWLLR